ncbi:MAG: hypothetical protein BWY63_01207 [Chloroflexi bacterium ADurb.Bin360]|nr:MAG: hypothetical protein BWY63_01207 [Chloroflexi bacterium ADurb.Bin360]
MRRDDAAQADVGRAIGGSQRPSAEADGTGCVVVEFQPLRCRRSGRSHPGDLADHHIEGRGLKLRQCGQRFRETR